MHDFDPRDFDSRDRDDDRRPDLGRGGHAPENARVPDRATRDPRDIAIRHVDLPRGPRREPVRGRDRDYEINGNQSRVLATVGAFRVVSSRDLEASFGRAGNPRSSELRHLRESGLVQTAPLPGHRDRVVTLTEQGRELLEGRRRPGEGGPQAFYAGVRKPRELEHDVQVYRAYLEAADRLTERGDRLRRVVLDYELKREYQRFLQERNRGRADSDGRPDRDAEEIALWAVEHNLPVLRRAGPLPRRPHRVPGHRRALPRGGRGGDDRPLPRRPRGGRRALGILPLQRHVRTNFGRPWRRAGTGRRSRSAPC